MENEKGTKPFFLYLAYQVTISIALYYISLLIGFDQIRNPNVNNRDHLVGRPTRAELEACELVII